ncbi:hypothetical protein [Argonema antarcticum]|uniref:hypothetical protein n=1 Tax=Argonema antarcticum TaxID=2942763 RepID=UPI00201199B2|nr:hypothetical protein [Argonema antarcticum]MCL1474137.1 hypothetical protein [Argonema antarcticum A004/B2]
MELEWVYYRLREGYWYDNQKNEQSGKTLNLSMANLGLEERLNERNPTAKIIETLYIFRCLYIQNNEWQRFDQTIEQYGLAMLDKIINSCFDRFGSSVRKFELGIQYYYEVDCGSAPGKSAWLDYTKDLMLKRCLDIWPSIKPAQIKRGLALQKSGEHSVNGHIGALNAKKAIKKQEYGAEECWIVVVPEALKPSRSELLPESGIGAARKRAREWRIKRTRTSDK